MVSIYAIHKLPRIKRKKRVRVKALNGCPQRRGVIVRLTIMPPRKPNSARRKAARVRVSTRKEIFAYIPGIGHNLLKFSHVLLGGGIIPDLPGVHYTMIRGAKDLHGIRERTSARSKYGTKIWRRVKKKNRVAASAAFKKKLIDSGEFVYNGYEADRGNALQKGRLVGDFEDALEEDFFSATIFFINERLKEVSKKLRFRCLFKTKRSRFYIRGTQKRYSSFSDHFLEIKAKLPSIFKIKYAIDKSKQKKKRSSDFVEVNSARLAFKSRPRDTKKFLPLKSKGFTDSGVIPGTKVNGSFFIRSGKTSFWQAFPF